MWGSKTKKDTAKTSVRRGTRSQTKCQKEHQNHHGAVEKQRGNHKKKVAKPPTAPNPPINRKQARQRKSQGQATNRATITKIGETTKRNWKTPRENRRIPTGATRRREPKRRRQKQRRRRRQNQQPSLLARPPGFPVFPGTIHLFPQATIAGPQRPCNPTSWKVVEGRPDGSRCRSPNTTSTGHYTPPSFIHLFPQATIAGPQRPCNPTSWKVVEGRPDGSRCRSPNTPCFTSQRATATRATTTMTER
jgi:hypothetical protein